MFAVMPANVNAPNQERNSVSFNGSDEIMATNKSGIGQYLNISGRGLSMAYWVKVTTTSTIATRTAVRYDDAGGVANGVGPIWAYVFVNTGNVWFRWQIGKENRNVIKNQQFGPLYAVSPYSWHLFSMSYAFDEASDMSGGVTGAMKVYLDGERVKDSPSLLTDSNINIDQDYNHAGWISIGADNYTDPSGASFAPVTIYDVAMWDRALIAAEMKAIYNEGRPIDYRENQQRYESARNLTYWWTAKYNSDVAESVYSFGRPTKHRYGVSTHEWADLMQDQVNMTVANNKVSESPW